MPNAKSMVVVIVLMNLLAKAVVAQQLPPAPSELGVVRRSEHGLLEVVKPPTGNPSDASPAVSEPVAAPGAGEKGVAQGSTAMASAGRTLVVGPRQQIRSVKEAARLARDGDIVEIQPGEYRQQAVVWTQARLTIRGIGKRPLLIADGDSAEGKALWVVRDGDVRIENLEFRGVRVSDGNGAGIRFERGHLKVVRCAFFDNEMGILTGNVADAVLEVEDSEFAEAPKHAQGLHHLLYVGRIARLSVRGSRLQQGFRGHLLKSRARESEIAYNLLLDGAAGSASLELEFPNGGVAWVIGNIIGQSASTENRDLISYGAEGEYWPDNALYLAHNTLVNDRVDGRFLHVWNPRIASGVEVWAINNLLLGYPADFQPQAPGRYEGNRRADRSVVLSGTDGLPYGLPSNSPLRGSASAPGSVRQRSLAPTAEFRLPAGTRPLVAGKPLSAGALQ